MNASTAPSGGHATQLGESAKSVPTLLLLALASAPCALAATTFHEHFRPGLYLGFAAPVLLTELIFTISSILIGRNPISFLLNFKRSTLIATLVFLTSASFVSFWTAPLPAISQLFLVVTLAHLTFAFALATGLGSFWRDEGERLLIAVGYGAAAYCILVYLLLLTMRDIPEFDWKHLGLGVSNVRQLGFFGLTSAAVGGGLAIGRVKFQPAGTKLRNFAFITVGSGLCIWSGGRSAAGALVLMLSFALTICVRQRRLGPFNVILSALLAGVFLSLVWMPSDLYGLPRIIYSTGFRVDDSNGFSSGRMKMWVETIAYISNRPMLGYGMGQFKFTVVSALNQFLHPHNSILQFLFQWGLVGSTALAVIVAPALKSACASIRVDQTSASLIAVLLLVAHFSMSMLEGNLFHVYPTSVVILALVVLRYSTSKAGREAAPV